MAGAIAHAVAPCNGSLRLVPVKEFNGKDTVECPFCTLSPKAKRVVHPHEKRYYELPNHRPSGKRQASKIDWTDPQ